jgi:hypothetical protein
MLPCAIYLKLPGSCGKTRGEDDTLRPERIQKPQKKCKTRWRSPSFKWHYSKNSFPKEQQQFVLPRDSF